MAALGFCHPSSVLAPIKTKTSSSSSSYELLEEINRGTYGIVYRARDTSTGQIVAAKRELQGLCPSTKREVLILSSLPSHPSIVQLKDVLLHEDTGHVDLIVMEYIPNDLRRLMSSMKPPRRFNIRQIKRMSKALLQGVSFLHNNGVMHRDLKPGNILIDPTKGDFKICDFGLARAFDPARPTGPYSSHVGTLRYQAPELLLEAKEYSCAVDMWSVGCIVAELVLGEGLFRGRCEKTQLQSIFDVLGTPDELSWPGFTDLVEDKMYSFEPQPCKKLRLKLANGIFFGSALLTPCGFDLVERLLTYDPCKRISAREALKHAWFNEIEQLY